MKIKQYIFFMSLTSLFWLCNAGKSGGDSHITQSWSPVLSGFPSQELVRWKESSDRMKSYFLTDVPGQVPTKPILCLYCSLCSDLVAFENVFARNGHCSSTSHKANQKIVEKNQVALYFFNFHKDSEKRFREERPEFFSRYKTNT